MKTPEPVKASQLRRLKRPELNDLGPVHGIDDAVTYPNKESLIEVLLEMMKDPDPLLKISHHKKRAFLAAFRILGNISDAATKAGCSRRSHYLWLRNDPDYASAFGDADDAATDLLERHAVSRATIGVSHPMIYRGKIVMNGTGEDAKPIMVTKYSDYILMRLLEARRPDKYKPQQVIEHQGEVKMPHTLDLSKLSIDEIRVFREIVAKAEAASATENAIDATDRFRNTGSDG